MGIEEFLKLTRQFLVGVYRKYGLMSDVDNSKVAIVSWTLGIVSAIIITLWVLNRFIR